MKRERSEQEQLVSMARDYVLKSALGLDFDLDSTRALRANPNSPNTNGWQERHNAALANPRIGFESAFIRMAVGWLEYAEEYKQRYEALIGNDGFMGSEWEAIGGALRTLLNGELGRLDAGTLDGFLLSTMRLHGINIENK